METKKTTKNQWNTALVLWKDKQGWQTLGELTKSKREKTKINKIGEQKGAITTDSY
jgi:hypothetical protein